MGVKCCCHLCLRTASTVIGSVFLVIAVIQFIASVVLMISSDSSVVESTSFDSLTEELLNILKNKNIINKGNVQSPKYIVTGTVEAENTTSYGLSTVVSERFKIALLVISIIHILSNLALIIGAIKRNGNFVSLWLWLQMVLFLVSALCCTILTLIFFSAKLDCFGAILIALFVLLSSLFLYCYTLVYKFYHELYVPSEKLDHKNPAKIGYELQNFSSEAEYI